jgi:hypothetical protein
MGLFGKKWEPAIGVLIKARFDRHDPSISKKAGEAAARSAYEGELR